MKRNLMPLLGVALVAAIVATGIFYALLLPKLRPVAEAASAPQPSGPGEMVPSGKRAISIHPIDSRGVMQLLGEGGRVDIELVDVHSAPPQVVRIQEDVQVLKVSDGDLTILVTPSDADRIMIADASSRLRLAMRNPKDRGRHPAPQQSASVSPVAPQ